MTPASEEQPAFPWSVRDYISKFLSLSYGVEETGPAAVGTEQRQGRAEKRHHKQGQGVRHKVDRAEDCRQNSKLCCVHSCLRPRSSPHWLVAPMPGGHSTALCRLHSSHFSSPL